MRQAETNTDGSFPQHECMNNLSTNHANALIYNISYAN